MDSATTTPRPATPSTFVACSGRLIGGGALAQLHGAKYQGEAKSAEQPAAKPGEAKPGEETFQDIIGEPPGGPIPPPVEPPELAPRTPEEATKRQEDYVTQATRDYSLEDYVDQAMRNLRAASRTAAGTLDVSSTPGRAGVVEAATGTSVEVAQVSSRLACRDGSSPSADVAATR
jgi:hypothetical protein